MKRDARGSLRYWNERVEFEIHSIEKRKKVISEPGGDESYRPQYVFELAKDHYELIIKRYSRGDAVAEFNQYFSGLLDAWEEAERLGQEVWTDEQQYMRHAWAVNLDHYIFCFWLTGLALTLELPDEQWQRLLALMGNEGSDALLDRVIATRQADRKIGNNLCFPQAYAGLLEVVNAPVDSQPDQLRKYLDGWFPSLKNAGSPEFPKDLRTPFWWDFYQNEQFGMKGGAYFGCWCIEAAAVAKAFGIDDRLCLDHPHYPGDLLKDNRCKRYPDVASAYEVPTDQKPAMISEPNAWDRFRLRIATKWFGYRAKQARSRDR